MVHSFCPSFDSRLPEANGQGRPTEPAVGRLRNIHISVIAVCLFLVLVVTAVLMQVFILSPVAVPVAANASTSPSPAVTPYVSGTPEILTTPAQPLWDVNNTGNHAGPELPVTIALNPSSLSDTPAFAGPLITINGTPPYSYHAPPIGSSPDVPVINTTSLAAQVHGLVNRVRQDRGLSALGSDAALASLARAHSTDMASHGYFGHVNLDERDATARGAAAGYTCRKDYDTYYTYGIAENLFATYRYNSVLFVDGRARESDWKSEDAIAEETMDAWMNSPDHRDNILDPGTGRQGIGVAIAKDDLVFITQDFC